MERSIVLKKGLSLTFDAAVIGQLSELHRQTRKRPTWSLGYRVHDRKFLYVYKVTMRLSAYALLNWKSNNAFFYTVDLSVAVNNIKILSVSYQYFYGKFIASDTIQSK